MGATRTGVVVTPDVTSRFRPSVVFCPAVVLLWPTRKYCAAPNPGCGYVGCIATLNGVPGAAPIPMSHCIVTSDDRFTSGTSPVAGGTAGTCAVPRKASYPDIGNGCCRAA